MKTSLLLLPLLYLSSFAQGETLIRMTDEMLAAKGKALTQAQNSQTSKVTKTIAASSAQDPLKHSSILASNGSWTFVPKGSILNVPARFSKKVVSKPSGKFIPFPQFMRTNYGWMQTREVSKDELLGNLEEPEVFYESIRNSNFVLIATNSKSPVSTSLKK